MVSHTRKMERIDDEVWYGFRVLLSLHPTFSRCRDVEGAVLDYEVQLNVQLKGDHLRSFDILRARQFSMLHQSPTQNLWNVCTSDSFSKCSKKKRTRLSLHQDRVQMGEAYSFKQLKTCDKRKGTVRERQDLATLCSAEEDFYTGALPQLDPQRVWFKKILTHDSAHKCKGKSTKD